ncbi:uncharacterized protein CIMG_03334 [Coccidioides immitis RS]|uniref:Uncharacterized protein n=1 Tax=Coccidioides immitis (strain RS) TaxID=246410 RepID=J3KB44_COCIM|nr:uncharacterized protein CIMG_03334 [Coccidioides immitis RS]EAS32310.3 hypothetical protein CIMG_03334 [Coccidioides immitis RS]
MGETKKNMGFPSASSWVSYENVAGFTCELLWNMRNRAAWVLGRIAPFSRDANVEEDGATYFYKSSADGPVDDFARPRKNSGTEKCWQ